MIRTFVLVLCEVTPPAYYSPRPHEIVGQVPHTDGILRCKSVQKLSALRMPLRISERFKLQVCQLNLGAEKLIHQLHRRDMSARYPSYAPLGVRSVRTRRLIESVSATL